MESDVQGERERTIHERAYFLWEEEGRPNGKHLEHWLRAETEIDQEPVAGVTNNGKFIAASLKRQVYSPRSGRRRSECRFGQFVARPGIADYLSASAARARGPVRHPAATGQSGHLVRSGGGSVVVVIPRPGAVWSSQSPLASGPTEAAEAPRDHASPRR